MYVQSVNYNTRIAFQSNGIKRSIIQKNTCLPILTNIIDTIHNCLKITRHYQYATNNIVKIR